MTSVTYDYSGARVLVTGAGTGIGFAIAEAFAAAGATVTLMGHLAEQVEPAAATLRARFDAAIRAAVGDVTVEDELASAVAIAASGGHLDIAIANAGSAVPGPILLLEKSAWDYTNALNITGTALTIKHAGLAMRADGGRIITISSAAAKLAIKCMAPYSATKAAVEMLTRAAAIELAAFGITVNCISPGWIRTEAAGFIPPKAVNHLTEATLLGAGAEPAVIADGALHLCSPAAAFVTGTVVEIGGGLHAGGGEDFTELSEMIHGADRVTTVLRK
jgi:NAD(P)-dependent dehydrogenase (short-subunit alcohol dehydrogenase family)